MPSIEVFEHRHALALEGFCYDHARLGAPVSAALLERINDLGVIVAIDNRGEPAEGSKFVREAIHIELIHRVLALSKTVHIDDGVQIRRFVVARQGRRLPYRSFRALTIAEKHICGVRESV